MILTIEEEKSADKQARSILLLTALNDEVVDAVGLMNTATAAEC